uniref:Uncharacterized protein n=1 Tax=Avena sativa TaxID=4498 RepID=A0ACD5Y427_AVESA
MARRLAFVRRFGEREIRDPAQSPLRNLYRDLIRNVVVSRGQYITQPAHTGSSHSGSSGASSSYCSSCSASAAATSEFFAHDQELTKIARQMVSDGSARRMVNGFGGGGPDHPRLETWFTELDVDWILQFHEEQLQEKSESSLQELIERWIRALTVISVSMAELVLVVAVKETPAVARFGKASMAKMLVFVDAIIPALKEEEKLRAVVDMYVCLSSVSYRFASNRFMLLPILPKARTILKEIGGSLSRKVISLREAISSTMEEVRTLVENDDSWAILIQRGRGEVHRNTRLMVDYIRSMVKVDNLMNLDTANLRGLIDDSVHHLKDQLLRKSEHASDPSLRYLFLLNNFYYSVAQLSEPQPGHPVVFTLECKTSMGRYLDPVVFTPECKMFMGSYLDVSWGHVRAHIQITVSKGSCLDVSCGPVLFSIPKLCFSGSRQHRNKISELAKFESAFHKTYQDQKFWKVPDPQLRAVLRKAIAETVLPDYHRYLKKHPELQKHVNSGSSSPDMLKELLGELFEG